MPSYFLISGQCISQDLAPEHKVKINPDRLYEDVSPLEAYKSAARHGGLTNIFFGGNTRPVGHEYVLDRDTLQRTGAERINRAQSRDVSDRINGIERGRGWKGAASRFGSRLQHVLIARGEHDNKQYCFRVDASHMIGFSVNPPRVRDLASAQYAASSPSNSTDQLEGIASSVGHQILGMIRNKSFSRKRFTRPWERPDAKRPGDPRQEREALQWGDTVLCPAGGLPADIFGPHHTSKSTFSSSRPSGYIELYERGDTKPVMNVCLYYAKSMKHAFIEDSRTTAAVYKRAIQNGVRPMLQKSARRAWAAASTRKRPMQGDAKVCAPVTREGATDESVEVRCRDGIVVRVDARTRALASRIQEAIRAAGPDQPPVVEIPQCSADTVRRVKTYVEQYASLQPKACSPELYGAQGASELNEIPAESGPAPPRAPICAAKSLEATFTDQWGRVFIENRENQKRVFDIAVAAWILGVRSLQDLACAHIATRIVGETEDSVVKSVTRTVHSARQYDAPRESQHGASAAQNAAVGALTRRVEEYLPTLQRAATLCIEVRTPYSSLKWKLRDFQPTIDDQLATRLTFARGGGLNELALSTVPRGLAAGVWFDIKDSNAIPVRAQDRRSICNGGEFKIRAMHYIDGYHGIVPRSAPPPASARGGQLTILAYDIECASTEDSQFPDPRRDTNGVIVIAATVHSGSGDDVHIFALSHLCGSGSGIPAATQASGRFVHRKYFNGAYPVKVHPFVTEEGLHLGFVDFVRSVQPDVMMGWNSSGFDLPYLMQRLPHIQMRNQKKDRWTTFMSLFGDRALLEAEETRSSRAIVTNTDDDDDDDDDDEGIMSAASDDDLQSESDGEAHGGQGSASALFSTRAWVSALPPSPYTHVLWTRNRDLAFQVTGPTSRKPRKINPEYMKILRVDPSGDVRVTCTGIDAKGLRVGRLEIEFSGWVDPQAARGGRAYPATRAPPGSLLTRGRYRLRFDGAEGGATLLNARLLCGLFQMCCGKDKVLAVAAASHSSPTHFDTEVGNPGDQLVRRIARTLSRAHPATRTPSSRRYTCGYRTMGMLPGKLLDWRRDAATKSLVVEGGTGVTMADLLLVARKKGWKSTKFKGGLKLANVADYFLAGDASASGSSQTISVNAIAKMKIRVEGYENLGTIALMNRLHFDMFPGHDKEDVLRYCFVDALIVSKLSVLKDFNYANQALTKCRIYGMPSIAVAAQCRDFAQFKFLLKVSSPREGFVMDMPLPDPGAKDLDLKLPGALVMAPKEVGKRYERVTILDFLSMYPSIMILYMLCLSTRTDCSALGPQLPANGQARAWGMKGIRYLMRLKKCMLRAARASTTNNQFRDQLERDARVCDEFASALRKRTAGALLDVVKRHPHRAIQFVAPLGGCPGGASAASPEPVGYIRFPGLIDTVLRLLFYKRNATKAKIKSVQRTMRGASGPVSDTEKKGFEAEIHRLETLSLEQKIAMNTVYGVLKFLDPNMLATVTMFGRWWLRLGEGWCHDMRGGEVVAGDTDGLMIHLPRPPPRATPPPTGEPLQPPSPSSYLVRAVGMQDGVLRMSSDNALRAIACTKRGEPIATVAEAELSRRRAKPGRRPPESGGDPARSNAAESAASIPPDLQRALDALDARMRTSDLDSIASSTRMAEALADKINFEFRRSFCPRGDQHTCRAAAKGRCTASRISKQPGDPYLEMDYAARVAIGVKAKRYCLLLKSKFKASGLQCGKTTMCEFARSLHLAFFDRFIRKEEISAWEIICTYFRTLFRGTLPLRTLASVCMYNPDVNPDLKSAANTIAKQIKQDTGRLPGKERMEYIYQATATPRPKTERAVIPRADIVPDLTNVLESVHRPNFSSGKGGSDGDMATVLKACDRRFPIHKGPPACTAKDTRFLEALGATPHPDEPGIMRTPPGMIWVDATLVHKWRGDMRYLLVRLPSSPLTASRRPSVDIKDDDVMSECSYSSSDSGSDSGSESEGPAETKPELQPCAEPLIVAELRGVWENGALCAAYRWIATPSPNPGVRGRPLRSIDAYAQKKVRDAMSGRPDPVASLTLADMVMRLCLHAQISAQNIARMQYTYNTFTTRRDLDPLCVSDRWTTVHIQKVESALRKAVAKRKRKYGPRA